MKNRWKQMKKLSLVGLVGTLLILPLSASAEMGQMGLRSKDVSFDFIGSLKSYPTFLSNADFNSRDTAYDYVLDENGPMDGASIRNEVRIGWLGKGNDWDFKIILEADFNLNKSNGDRGADASTPVDSGMTGEDFGVEKLAARYNFGPFTLETGWDDRFLDISTGGLLYGDDHPFIGLQGGIGDKFSWEILYLIIQDDIENMEHGKAIGPLDSDSLDWRVYTAKGKYELPNGLVVSGFYAYSDNSKRQTADARVHYMGAEAYGKLGMFTPRLEFVYATGDTDRWSATDREYDISAYAAYGSVDIDIAPVFIPYIGATLVSGDGDADDDNIDAFNAITNIARYTPTFGMENSFVSRLVPVLGTHLYSNTPEWLPKSRGVALNPGYGGIGNSSSGDSPGLVSYGIGFKGSYQNLSYKVQGLYMTFEDVGALEDLEGKSIDNEWGMEFDVLLTYRFNEHFSVGNAFAVFDPGDGIQDIWGEDFDETAFLDTIEFKWTW